MQPQSITVIQGETLRMPITILDANGEPLDLTGASAHFGLARTAGDAVLVGNSTSPPTAAASVRSPAEEGVVDVRIDAEVVVTLLNTYAWECRVVDVVGDEVAVARGYLTVRPRVFSLS